MVPMWRMFRPISLLLLLLLLTTRAATGQTPLEQTETPRYWRHVAPGEVSHVFVTDFDGDGFDEVAVVSRGGVLEMVRGDGSLLWDAPLEVDGEIVAASRLNDGLAVATREALLFFDADRALVRSRSIPPAAGLQEIATVGQMASATAPNSGRTETLAVLFANGALHLYNETGRLLWQYTHTDTPNPNATPTLHVDDLTRDGQEEILLSYTTERGFGRLDLIQQVAGETIWSEPVTGAVTSQHTASVDGQRIIAFGTSVGEIHLLDGDRRILWRPRTLNTTITALRFVEWPGFGSVLLAGTETGKLVGFRVIPSLSSGANGQRIFDRVLCGTSDLVTVAERTCEEGIYGSIQTIATPNTLTQSRQPTALVLSIDLPAARRIQAELLFVGFNFETIARYGSGATVAEPLIADTNRDGNFEALLTTFGAVELLSGGTYARTTAEAFAYDRLDDRPTAWLVDDFEQDGEDDLLVAAEDGRIHRLSANNDRALWIAQIAGEPVALRSMKAPGSETESHIVVAANLDSDPPTSRLLLLDASGNSLLPEPLQFDAHITALPVYPAENDTAIIGIGFDNGRIVAVQIGRESGDEGISATTIWSHSMENGVEAGVLLRRETERTPQFVFASQNAVQRIGLTGLVARNTPIQNPNQLCRTPAELLYLLENDGVPQQLCLLNRRIGLWQELLGQPIHDRSQQSSGYLYRPIQIDRWQRTARVDVGELFGSDTPQETIFSGETQTFNEVTAVFSGDLTGNGRNDIVIGFENGTVQLDLSDSDETILDVEAPVTAIVAPNSNSGEQATLVVITENSLVRFFRFRPNHPPMITVPVVTTDSGDYTISASVLDVEAQPMLVGLDLYDETTQSWQPAAPGRQTTGAIDRLEWRIDPPLTESEVRYRLRYADGDDHIAAFEPPPGPIPVATISRQWRIVLPVLLISTLLIAGLVQVYRRELPVNQARRFLRAVSRTPAMLLIQLRQKYNQSNGDSDFFINLATVARQQQKGLVAGLADGLYLLAERPGAGLDIVTATLDEAAQDPRLTLLRLVEWQAMFGTTREFIEAPTLTELTLLRPKLDKMIRINEQTGGNIGPFPRLVPVFDALRDSERVETVGDRLAWLGDADILLRRLEDSLRYDEFNLSRSLVGAIVQHWRGLLNAAIESLRGRARLDVQLRTRRLAPQAASDLVLEVTNTGRAPAQQIQIRLLPGEASPLNGNLQKIESLSPGWKRTVHFGVELPETERFRVAFAVAYSDRQQQGHSFEYANMVELLALPEEEFRPIPNPYSPGTPLRRNSTMFFGRDDLFQFIAEEADRASQQRVLILVGQRRTGKTSALLRLGQHIPSHLLSVYIDCQSLGVLPGMKAFFQDLAWQIADTLDEYDIEIDVPEVETLDTNPGKWFQHDFIPAVRKEMPAGSKLVLVFDEFEALENLVNDNILPTTIFSYLRHLMQHGEGLSFIFVGTHRLQELTTNYWSVLFNIALYSEISYLHEEAATLLITEPVAQQLVYDDLALDKIWRITAGHPYFLQLVCYTLVRHANARRVGYITISDVNDTANEMIGLGEVHFAYIWERSDSAERAILLAVAHLLGNEADFRPADIINAMAPYNVTLTPAEVTAALNSLVRRNIVQTIGTGATPRYDLKLGLVGLWIERTKSLNNLHENRQS